MSQTIKLKRGLESNRLGITPVAGELVYTTDNLEVFFGDGTTLGGNEINYLNTRTGGEVNGPVTLNSGVTIAAGDPNTNVFQVLDSEGAGLFEVTENGNAIIGGVLTVNGAGQSSFAGDVLIGGSLTVNGDATVAVDLSADTLTLTGDLNVQGNTTLGNEPTDTTTIQGVFNVTGPTTITGATDITGTTTITGDLIVSGTTTTVNSNEVNIGDSIILLNSDETGTPTQDGGIELERGTLNNVSLYWDEALDQWMVTKVDGADTQSSVRLLDTDDLTAIQGTITDQAFGDHSDTVFTAVATSDLVMFDGTNWVNSNTIDGGTF